MPRSQRRFINYPTNRLLGVLDSPGDVEATAAELVEHGIRADDILVLAGPEGAARLDGMGVSGGLLARALRAVQFMTMDQMPDFLLYETAIRTGRAVIAVRIRGGAERAATIETLRRRGAHFLNLYGRFATEEISLWRGPEPAIPDVLRR